MKKTIKVEKYYCDIEGCERETGDTKCVFCERDICNNHLATHLCLDIYGRVASYIVCSKCAEKIPPEDEQIDEIFDDLIGDFAKQIMKRQGIKLFRPKKKQNKKKEEDITLLKSVMSAQKK